MSFNFKNLSILVVEDTDAVRKLIVSVLETLGVGNVIQARNGEDGFQKFINYNPDIVLTDWLMDKMSGVDMIRKIRRDPQSKNCFVPIVLITGFSALPRVEEARDAGVTEFLIKPFTANDIATRLAYVINRPRDFIDSRDYFGPDRRRIDHPSFNGPYQRKSDR